ncbi:aldo/keto reductase [Yinghuangia sp. YIM S10712]|uniref:aldo/keto reductase n=1 Tax=Yinghuangia sp. YIM S10712 TaxID=3436930 RepID=UPI003F52956E
MTADLGLGTHRCPDVTASARMAVVAGARWIDTAPNYAGGLAEQALAPVLAEHPHVRVSTKAGFLPRRVLDAIMDQRLLPARPAGGHSLAPQVLRLQVTRSRHELGCTPDLVFVHNPEHPLWAPEVDARADTRAVLAGLLTAFDVLEEEASAGRIGGYGVATWSGFSDGLLSIDALLAMARTVGGAGHHLHAVQLPLSLIEFAAVDQAWAGCGPVAEAHAAGLDVFASAPLHGGAVLTVLTPAAIDLLTPGGTAAQAALALLATTPGVTRILLSTRSVEHWHDAARALEFPAPTPDQWKIIRDVFAP